MCWGVLDERWDGLMEGGSRPEASWVVCYSVVERVVVETILSPMPFHTMNGTFQFCNKIVFCFIHYRLLNVRMYVNILYTTTTHTTGWYILC